MACSLRLRDEVPSVQILHPTRTRVEPSLDVKSLEQLNAASDLIRLAARHTQCVFARDVCVYLDRLLHSHLLHEQTP